MDFQRYSQLGLCGQPSMRPGSLSRIREHIITMFGLVTAFCRIPGLRHLETLSSAPARVSVAGDQLGSEAHQGCLQLLYASHMALRSSKPRVPCPVSSPQL
jgi:hypothetical protein